MPGTPLAAEIGYTGLDEYNGYVNEHWISDLRSSSRRIRVLDEMVRLDPIGSSMLNTTSIFMRGANAHVSPASDAPVDVEKAKFVDTCLHTMSKSWEATMADIVYFIAYGFFDMELVYKRDERTGRIVWKKWSPRHPCSLLRWDMDNNGGLQGMYQNEGQYIPIEKLLHFTTTGGGKANPEGISPFEGAYTSWFFVKNLSILEGIICERLSGTPVMKLPENATVGTAVDSDLSIAKKIVRNVKLGDDMGITEPPGFAFRYEMPQGRSGVDIGAVILRHQRDFARNMMMDFIMLGGGDQGSWALSKDKSQMYVNGLNTYLRIIASVINRHAIPRLLELNAFPASDKYPELYFDRITKIDIGDYAQTIANLFNAGAVTYTLDTENQVRRQVGLDETSEPGLMLKPNLPANPGTGGERVALPETQAVRAADDAPHEFADGLLQQENSEEFADWIALKLLREYDRWSKALLARLLKSKNQTEFEAITDTELAVLVELLKDKLRDGMFAAWKYTAGTQPTIDALHIMSSELLEQARRLEVGLATAIKQDLLAAYAQTAGMDKITAEALLSLAASKSRFRVTQYAGPLFKFHANHGVAYRAQQRIKAAYPSAAIALDWNTGALRGDELLGRYVGPEDARTCPDCEAEIARGWNATPAPIGSLRCGPSCRHHIEYKYRSKVFK